MRIWVEYVWILQCWTVFNIEWSWESRVPPHNRGEKHSSILLYKCPRRNWLLSLYSLYFICCSEVDHHCNVQILWRLSFFSEGISKILRRMNGITYLLYRVVRISIFIFRLCLRSLAQTETCRMTFVEFSLSSINILRNNHNKLRLWLREASIQNEKMWFRRKKSPLKLIILCSRQKVFLFSYLDAFV